VRTPTSGRTVRSLVQICLVAALAGGVLADATAASAARFPGWGGGAGAGSNSGNGKHNRNSYIINSPSVSHDIQHIRNVNVDGNTVTPAALCNRARRCKINQNLTVFDR
jgi:hypothetical protein